jgi:hypothetical protein
MVILVEDKKCPLKVIIYFFNIIISMDFLLATLAPYKPPNNDMTGAKAALFSKEQNTNLNG